MSAIVVAGGVSKRFGQDKGLIRLAEKPLVLHVLDTLAPMVDEVVVVVNSEIQEKKFAQVIKQKARIVIDKATVQTPLVGALAGFETIQSGYTLLLACDTPFLSTEILRFLLDVCINKTATIPRWTNGDIEPLQAVYDAKTAAKAAKTALENGKLDMRSMIANMQNIRYISTTVLRQLDSKLITFFNINTLNDLKKAEAMIKHHAY
ncbi:MAG: molybdenum cofactor guanylyltransferase [Candidatus Bathyarchaeota archaeon]|nr:molybdenum cofactor guanylyltransferase [Candidatus Bathyarchaeota archaeon]MDH5495155.1 molybdenum cofactor guanylyltransferase [Candidatus Bathyarchaeota archaeon]